MELQIHTEVEGDFRDVFGQFNRELFLQLAPAFPRLQLLRFDGSAPGDLVEVKLSGAGVSACWKSKISESVITKNEAWFTDEGVQNPWPLQTWRHTHLVTQLSGNKSKITDHIRFGTGNRLLDLMVYPILYAAFSLRKPVYRKHFSQLANKQNYHLSQSTGIK